YFLGIPYVWGSIYRFDGQASVFAPRLRRNEDALDQSSASGGPCYRCLYPEPPPPDDVWTCSQVGVLGAVAGVMGTLQATEVLKEIMDIGQSMRGRLLIFDALAGTTRMVKVKPDPSCKLCGPNATIRDLSIHRDSDSGRICVA
ncbi:MAG: ThiF family adenylyltransferase, partial [Rhodobacteraceae bacterium]|nr:ThiF family adenylyltransferase [Paracoccaceae bacterium]